jgi:hypothetical protein
MEREVVVCVLQEDRRRLFPNETCVAAAVYRGRLRFSALPLRFLAWVLRR